MTKFVLVGGFPAKNSDEGKLFAEELVDGFDQTIRILDCLFARPEDTWEKTFESDKFFFGTNLRDRKVLLELADPSQFVEQVKKTDVVYFRGGKTKELIRILKQCEGWEMELEGKTVAGSSAGVNFLARYYYSLDALEVCEGLSILPIKALVHYKSDYNAPNVDWDKALHVLKDYGEDLEVVTFAEGEFKVL